MYTIVQTLHIHVHVYAFIHVNTCMQESELITTSLQLLHYVPKWFIYTVGGWGHLVEQPKHEKQGDTYMYMCIGDIHFGPQSV